MSLLRDARVHRVLGVLLGALFLYAAHDKILAPREFARIVYHYRILGPSAHLPVWPPNLLAVTLPWVEAGAGLLLVIGVWRREAAAVTALMLASFLIAVSYALLNGIDLANCGCFTVQGDGRAAGASLLAGDLALLAIALLLAGLPPRGATPE